MMMACHSLNVCESSSMRIAYIKNYVLKSKTLAEMHENLMAKMIIYCHDGLERLANN